MNSPELRRKIGKKIKKARIKMKRTQADVAKAAGLSPNYYACVERGEESISVERLQKITEVLGIKLMNI